jgi:hypothetical protein
MTRTATTRQAIRQYGRMALDFVRVTSGKDYFHQPPRLGGYFSGTGGYYKDFTGKSCWTGKYLDGVPALYVPLWNRHLVFPIMVLQHGLGCVDRVLEGRRAEFAPSVHAVSQWLVENLREDGSLANRFVDLEPQFDYFSDNSAMGQGHALSFLVRAIASEAVAEPRAAVLRSAADRIAENMIRPLEAGGTALIDRGRTVFCEVCRRDKYVVLNGWIYALFGLIDYTDSTRSPAAAAALEASLDTLRAEVQEYVLPSRWSVYDNHGRLSSPYYHRLHIVLLDALERVTGATELRTACHAMKQGCSLRNKTWFTARKVVEKIRDRGAYVTQQ